MYVQVNMVDYTDIRFQVFPTLLTDGATLDLAHYSTSVRLDHNVENYVPDCRDAGACGKIWYN